MDLVVTAVESGAWVVLGVAGELDLSNAPVLRSRLHRAIADHPGRAIALDLGAAGFCDSVGLGILLGARRRARATGGDLELVDVPERVAAVIAAAGVSGALPCDRRREELGV
jgi:anti-sigma B factor antagonist